MQKELITFIAEQTNIYALENNSTFSTTNKEIEAYLGILLRMGITGLPRY